MNDDGEMNMNLFGMFIEFYVFLNDVKGWFGLVSWDVVKFMFEGNSGLYIIMMN